MANSRWQTEMCHFPGFHHSFVMHSVDYSSNEINTNVHVLSFHQPLPHTVLFQYAYIYIYILYVFITTVLIQYITRIRQTKHYSVFHASPSSHVPSGGFFFPVRHKWIIPSGEKLNVGHGGTKMSTFVSFSEGRLTRKCKAYKFISEEV